VLRVTSVYGESFFASLFEGSSSSARVIVPLVFGYLQPSSVLDVGCGSGAWLEQFHKSGVDDYLGVDGYAVAANSLAIPPAHFREIGLDISLDLGRRFDLVMSLEVAEHLSKESAGTFVETLCRHGDAVLFSAAIPGQGGAGHRNEQWQTYWKSRFERYGFEVFDLIRPLVWSDERVEWWYRQNMVLYACGNSAARLRTVAPLAMPLDLVHPSFSKEQADSISSLEEARAEVAAYRKRLSIRTIDRSSLAPAWRAIRHAITQLRPAREKVRIKPQ
jgi:SAM-dependent methyltransferase